MTDQPSPPSPLGFCGLCSLHVVKQLGADFTPGSTGAANKTQLHPAVTILGGIGVCWYHVADVDVNGALTTDARQSLAMERRPR